MGWLKYATLLGGLVGLALCAGLIAELALERRDASRYPPPGVLVDAGGYQMHVHCTGDGPVPIVLISGLGGWSQDWSAVQPLLSRTFRTCSFDRAGYGWSEEAGAPRIGLAAIEDMRTALDETGVGSPRIVVGHSLGGSWRKSMRSITRAKLPRWRSWTRSSGISIWRWHRLLLSNTRPTWIG